MHTYLIAYSFVFQFYEENDEVKVLAMPAAKVTPGLSSFAENLDGIVDYIMPLFESAAAKIPSMSIPDTRVYVKGTAGSTYVALQYVSLFVSQACASSLPLLRMPFGIGS